MSAPQDLLRAMFDAAVAAADPMTMLSGFLPEAPKGCTVVVGSGKASARMAQALEASWRGPLSGLVITRYGHACPCQQIEIVEAAHPVPDIAGAAASARVLETVQGLTADDLVIALISGGGSALMTLPAGGITLAEKQAINLGLLASGAAIGQMNVVRKHLSAIKGGRLAAAAHPARAVTLAISDVVGDDPATIASGPTVPDPTTLADARAVLAEYAIEPPARVADHLAHADSESPKPGDPRLEAAAFTIVANGPGALATAEAAARTAEVEPVMLGDGLVGEARTVAAEHAAIARRAAAENPGWPIVFLSGGELTVTVRGQGRGGPNTEYLLALAIALEGQAGVHALACDTDGIDGTEDNAGAVVAPDTLDRARAAGLDPKAALDANHAHGFFAVLGDLVVTGPSRTNVNDFRAILVVPAGER